MTQILPGWSTHLVVRYVGFGLWNTAFSWLAFAAIWKLGHAVAPLWLLACLAHLAATTQSFLTQKKWVFKPAPGSAFTQYIRFQLVYLGFLGFGLVMLQALNSQGWHPLIAQMLVMVFQALSGYVLGKSFIFSPASFSMRHLGITLVSKMDGSSPAWLAFLTSLFLFYRYLARPFYSSLDHLGHDFALSATALLEGRFWLQSNGVMAGLFNPPWFTPAWCAGAAFFADPQAGFYAPFQWLALIFDPFQATELSTLLFATAAFWGGYLLARYVLGWQRASASLFGVLGMANAFMPMRSAVGELGYQPLYLWTWLVLALCWPTRVAANWQERVASPALGVALVLTAWLHFGFAGMMVPAFLGVMLLCLVLVVADKVPLLPLLRRAAVGGVLAILLNATKLYEAASLMRNFPRDFYRMPGFASLHDALTASVMALVLPSEWTNHFGERRLSGVEFKVRPHEWALEFGLGALAVALFAAVVLLWFRRHGRVPQESPPKGNLQKYLASILVMLLCILPPLLLWDQGIVREFLKQIPILNSTTWPMRWIVIYLPITQWLLAWPIQQVLTRLPTQRQGVWAVIAMAGIWLGPIMAPTGYYLDPTIQIYDPKPVLWAHAQTRLTGQPQPIDRIEVPPPPHMLTWSRNDTMLHGASQGLCYNPIYGYNLESFPQIERLRPGAVLSTDEWGKSLIFNPACLVHPHENQCKPGDGFRMDDPVQRQAAENFVARRPFEWERPLLGKILSWVSQAIFWGLLSLIASWLWFTMLQTMHPKFKA